MNLLIGDILPVDIISVFSDSTSKILRKQTSSTKQVISCATPWPRNLFDDFYWDYINSNLLCNNSHNVASCHVCLYSTSHENTFYVRNQGTGQFLCILCLYKWKEIYNQHSCHTSHPEFLQSKRDRFILMCALTKQYRANERHYSNTLKNTNFGLGMFF